MLNPPLKKYESSWKKGLGLMFRLRPPSYGVLFPFTKKQKISIHMFFVFFPLDILWLDEEYVVTEQKTLKPFTAHSAKGQYVLEMPAGWAQKNKLRPGDSLESYIRTQTRG